MLLSLVHGAWILCMVLGHILYSCIGAASPFQFGVFLFNGLYGGNVSSSWCCMAIVSGAAIFFLQKNCRLRDDIGYWTACANVCDLAILRSFQIFLR